MMQAIIQPSTISGSITAPASKSVMQRACAAALIKGGTTILHNAGTSADDNAALDIIQKLGATVEYLGEKLLIKSNGIQPAGDVLNCGESGLSVRMFTPIAALSNKELLVIGGGSLTKRPLGFFDRVFQQLGVDCSSNNGLLPLQIKGPLQPKNIDIDGSLSSQFVTGLFFAYAAADAANVTVRVSNLTSKPYVNLTLQVMRDFGLKTPLHDDFCRFYFPQQSINQFANEMLQYTVEGDWSGAAFLLVAGAIGNGISVNGLDVVSTQADKVIIEALMQAGTDISVTDKCIRIGEAALQPFQFNAVDSPDLFPPLVALAAFCNGTSVIEGVHRLTHKESNRALTLQQEFRKLGVDIALENDKMLIAGQPMIKSAVVDSHGDHRIAMACAIAALAAEGEVTISCAEAVNKSYPAFWQHLQELGGNVSLTN